MKQKGDQLSRMNSQNNKKKEVNKEKKEKKKIDLKGREMRG